MNMEELFYYDETSESFLRWNQPRYSAKNNSWMCRKVGDLAGTLMKGGYWRVSVDRKAHLVHRIIWELFNGPIDEGFVIDHIDKNPSNNRIENLRCVSTTTNTQNGSLRSNNKTGVNGVNYSHPKDRSGRYSATWIDNGEYKSKTFSISKYGEDAFHLAIAYRKQMIQQLNENGANYSETHGEPNEN